MSSTDKNNAGTLRTSEKLGFGCGDLGFNMFWACTNLFLLFYYTDVLGLPNKTAGLIFMIAMLWDGISDPIIGTISSKTRSRWGSYRPYLLFGSIPLAASFALMFYKPDLEMSGLIIYTITAHILFRTCYTFVAVPYGSLAAQITRNSDERSTLALTRMLFATVGSIAIVGSMKLAENLGNGDLDTGFFRVALIYGAIAVPMFLITFAFTKEKNDEEHTQEVKDNTPPPTTKELITMLKSNGPFWIIFFSVILSMGASAITDKIGLYYLIYALNGKDDLEVTLGSIGIVSAISMPMWWALAKHYSKRMVWLTGLGMSMTISISLYFYPLTDVASIMPFLIAAAFAKGAMYFCFWATIPDTVEFGEWKTGTRAAGFIVSFCTFAQKAAMGLGIGLLGFLLDFIGYEANQVQTPETLESMKFLLTILPASCLFIVFLLVYRYPINQKFHKKLVNGIKIRQIRKARLNR